MFGKCEVKQDESKAVTVSQLRKQLEESHGKPNNPFLEYSKFEGKVRRNFWKLFISDKKYIALNTNYCICLINRPGCMLIKFWAYQGGHVFEVGAYYFPNIFEERFRTFLENNKTRDNKFISPQQGKTMCNSYHGQAIKQSKILFSCSGIMILNIKL